MWDVASRSTKVKALGGCRAFNVDYPKPPDSPFPAAVENVTRWILLVIGSWVVVIMLCFFFLVI